MEREYEKQNISLDVIGVRGVGQKGKDLNSRYISYNIVNEDTSIHFHRKRHNNIISIEAISTWVTYLIKLNRKYL